METKTSQFISYARQSISEKDCQAVLEALKGEWITRGEHVQAFEKAFASKVGARFALSFNSGSSSLMAACFAAKISAFDRVLTTPNTFIATAGSAVQCGAQVEFVDIDLNSGNLDVELLEKAMNHPHSRGREIIIPVHFSGIAMDMYRVDDAITQPETVVIEDAAHALGSCYPTGEKVGSCAYSAMTVFSFHPAKTITTGEGGMVTTNDEALYQRLKLYRNNGIEKISGTWPYQVKELTGNFHMTDFQAALGLSQLERLEVFKEKRNQLVSRYREKLQKAQHISLFDPIFDEKTCYHIFVVQIDFEALKTSREEVMDQLKKVGIGTEMHYIPLYRHQEISASPEHFPKMEEYFSKALTLPLYFDMTIKDIDRISNTLLAIGKK